ncbi:MAG: hypothetical protein K9J16_00045 [Melioribacteraceae bacterium]|nr:hypothetical protein [Melioribacteraceae bacterium]MCF8353899.1 hypothetical protein [Melioribacteraceae bacterium]MCF8392656.1 hypothetical protein [Melioribacteraceae bacterium]MCF8417677.1 hypothetical protein [Melioribacteraceae bacterium]
MNAIISKFNLYEYFRILLPGSYLTLIGYLVLQDIFDRNVGHLHWSNSVLLIVIISLVLGSLIYSFDLPRLFRNQINFLPTNLMEQEFPNEFPQDRSRENEHIYYSWYENSENKSKTKTELLSGLYHLNVNFAACAILGILVGLFMVFVKDDGFILFLNIILLVFSSLAAFTIVKCRLRFQWQRNYWQFRDEIILPNQES